IAIGIAAVVIARDYPMGTTLRMGPGSFPTALGAVLCAVGVYLVARGVRSVDPPRGCWSLRAPLLDPQPLRRYGLLVLRPGFVPALIVLIIGASAAGREFKLIEVVLLAIGLTAACVAVFVWALGLPYPLLAGF